MRSWLTVVSILIGIMAIFALVSFGVGVQKYMDSVAEDMGVDKLIVQAGGFQPPGSSTISFPESNIEAIRNVIGVDSVAPAFMTQSEIKYDLDRAGKWNYVMGMPPNGKEKEIMESLLTVEIYSGRSLRSQDKYKVVLGFNYIKDNVIFEKGLKLRDTIYIQDQPFKIVGFYQEIGNPADDANVYMPIDTAKEIYNEDNYQMVIVKAAEGENPSELVPKIEKALRRERGIDEGKEDFTVQTFEDAMAVFTNIVNVLNGVLVLIALISVVVSAINIANSMYTSVLERTNEIGVMKAIGAKNKVIMTVFLIESGLLGLIGGAIGIFFGYLIAKAGGQIAAQAGYSLLQPYFPWWLIVGCLTFSFLVGMFSGYFPSRQASKLKPVDALRYE
jgi:putative ABC transport system permease protein